MVVTAGGGAAGNSWVEARVAVTYPIKRGTASPPPPPPTRKSARPEHGQCGGQEALV